MIMMPDLQALFNKAYANLPEDERTQVIVVIEGKPYTWDRANDEIKNATPLGTKILNRLHELGIL